MVDFPRNGPLELDIEQVNCSLKNLLALLKFLLLNPQSLNGYGKYCVFFFFWKIRLSLVSEFACRAEMMGKPFIGFDNELFIAIQSSFKMGLVCFLLSWWFQAITSLKKGACLLKYKQRGKPKFCPIRLSKVRFWPHSHKLQKVLYQREFFAYKVTRVWGAAV